MSIARLAPLALAPLLLPASPSALACGGFFCEQLPIDQAAEQILFRQGEGRVTAAVRILYTGEAERFSWVVPVPDTPALSLGADATFTELDLVTRPRFALERRGEECPVDDAGFGTAGGATDGGTGAEAGDGGVTIVQEQTVGPFDTTVVESDNPDAMATWLLDNGYDLSDRGRDLIAPYVEAGMKFVAVKLVNGESTDAIQPLVMDYPADRPMIPIRLTAVAAEDDMGVLVWIVGDARAVPENYLHVEPNYARLNWYTGPQNAYASYQALITAAMNEVEPGGENDSGQGFATDYAGAIDGELVDGLFLSRQRRSELGFELQELESIDENAPERVIAQALRFLADRGIDPAPRLGVLRSVLPLPEGRGPDLYFDEQSLRETYTAEQLDAARDALLEAIVLREIEPLDTTLGLLPEGAYMTRLYTTLSADEMTLDPVFGYNARMDDQPLTREALLESSCTDTGTRWTLTLGAGTGREGELVITAEQPVPGSAPPATDAQPAAFRQSRTSSDAQPELLVQADVAPLAIGRDGMAVDSLPGGASDDDDDGFLGLAGPVTLGLLSLLVGLRRVRRRFPATAT